VFRMGVQEDIGALPVPPIPVELSQSLFHIRNMLQRGGFSDLTFGNVLQEISPVLVAQAAEAAMQILAPFHNILKLAISAITDSWYQTYLSFPSSRPRTWPEIDLQEFENTEVVSSYAVKIPGDLNNRINEAKSLNPDLRLATRQIMELLLPEVSDPDTAIAMLEGEIAKMTPEYKAIQLIHSFEQLGREAAALGNVEDAMLYAMVGNNLRSQITQSASQQDKTGLTAEQLPSLVDVRAGRNGSSNSNGAR